jgi:hypothetical protein
MAGLADYTVIKKHESPQLDNTHRSADVTFALPPDVDINAEAILGVVLDTSGAAKNMRVNLAVNATLVASNGSIETTDGFTGAIFQTIHEVVAPSDSPAGNVLKAGNNKITVSLVPVTAGDPIGGALRFSDLVLWWRHSQHATAG